MTADSEPSHEEILAQADLFAHLDSSSLDHLASAIEVVPIENGSTVCREGEAPDAIYVVARGHFGVFATRSDALDEVHVRTLVAGEYFGETILLDGGLPTSTIRAEGSGELLRLSRDRALELFEIRPAAGHAIGIALRRLLSSRDPSAAQVTGDRQMWDPSAPVLNRMSWAMLGLELERLSPERRGRVLEASVLEEASLPALRTLVGEHAETVAQDLQDLGVLTPSATGPSLHALRERYAQEIGLQQADSHARAAAMRLARAGRWDDALAIHARLRDYAALVEGLGLALRAPRPLSTDRALLWADRIPDDEALRDPDVVVVRAWLHEQQGNIDAAIDLLARALGPDAPVANLAGYERLTAEHGRLEAFRESRANAGRGKARPLFPSLRGLWRKR